LMGRCGVVTADPGNDLKLLEGQFGETAVELQDRPF
jgi:hypothetical protein